MGLDLLRELCGDLTQGPSTCPHRGRENSGLREFTEGFQQVVGGGGAGGQYSGGLSKLLAPGGKAQGRKYEEEKAIGHFNVGRVLSSIIREFQLGVYRIYQDRSVHQSPALRALQHYKATISLIWPGLPGWFFHGGEED